MESAPTIALYEQTDKLEFKITSCVFEKDGVYYQSAIKYAPAGVMGSDANAAGGRYSEQSEWPRSTAEEGASSPTMMSGTATGQTFRHSTT